LETSERKDLESILNSVMHTNAAASVFAERVNQEVKWGEKNHDPYRYSAILMEEIGEFCQATLQTQFGGEKGGIIRMRCEAVQIAAVALAIIECLDRNEGDFREWYSETERRCSGQTKESEATNTTGRG